MKQLMLHQFHQLKLYYFALQKSSTAVSVKGLIAKLCLKTPLPIPLCTSTTIVQYKTDVTVLNVHVPVFLFGHCWYKAYLVLHAY